MKSLAYLLVMLCFSSFATNTIGLLAPRSSYKICLDGKNDGLFSKGYRYNLEETKALLLSFRDLNPLVSYKVLASLQCLNKHHKSYSNILTIIDYSKPSNEKRLWVFDLQTQQLLFHTYVSHGIATGFAYSNLFSNRYNSKASSIGLYKTDKAYRGREGVSLKLQGLEPGFNDNAMNRSIVMHGGWYMEEPFIKKYGRSGRSWGCPAVPLSLANALINTIKDNGLLVIYYPEDKWLLTSRFLNCTPDKKLTLLKTLSNRPLTHYLQHDTVFFANVTHRNNYRESLPILVIDTDTYQKLFKKIPNLTRVLRRQINHQEYIALNQTELLTLSHYPIFYSAIKFVVPTIKMDRGYYLTQMIPINLGKITGIFCQEQCRLSINTNQTIILASSNQFIRWLGL